MGDTNQAHQSPVSNSCVSTPDTHLCDARCLIGTMSHLPMRASAFHESTNAFHERSPERSKSTSPRRPLGAKPREPAAVLEQLHELTRRMEMAASEKDYIRAAEFQRQITVLLTRSASNSKAEVEQGSPRQHSEHQLKNRVVRAAVHWDVDTDEEDAVLAEALHEMRSQPEIQNSATNQETAICSAHEGDVDLLEAVLREMQLSATNQDTESEDDSPSGGEELAQVVMQELMQLQQIETQQMLVDSAEDAEQQQDGDTPILHEVDSDCESEEFKSVIAEAEALFKACSRGNKEFCETQRLRNAIWGNRALRARMETNRVLKEFYDILAEDRPEWSKFGSVQDPVYKISRELMVQYYIYCAQGDDDDLATDEVV